MISTLFKEGGNPPPLPVIPTYKAGEFGRWRIMPKPLALVPGYFSDVAEARGNYALEERHLHREKWKVWMSLTPMELESHILPIAEARGHVVICGLGMGMALFNIASKPEVTRVTVIENDRRVVRMFNQCADWGDWPGRGKVTLYVNDALGFTPESRPAPETLHPNATKEQLEAMMDRFAWTDVNFLYVDIWRTLGSWAALSDVQLIAANLYPEAVAYWGSEFDFVGYLADKNRVGDFRRATSELFREWVVSTKLPLIGEDYREYPQLAVQAVKNQARIGYRSKQKK